MIPPNRSRHTPRTDHVPRPVASKSRAPLIAAGVVVALGLAFEAGRHFPRPSAGPHDDQLRLNAHTNTATEKKPKKEKERKVERTVTATVTRTSTTAVTKPDLVEACPDTMAGYAGQPLPLRVICRCKSVDDAEIPVWGSDVYTSDSNVCRAAKHAGVIESRGDVVVWMQPGQPSYRASQSGGVNSGGYATWSSSFAFVEKPDLDAARDPSLEVQADANGESDSSAQHENACPASGTLLHSTAPEGTRATCVCYKPQMNDGAVWGTSVYTEDSSICRAAIHDGLGIAPGDEVTIFYAPGRSSYQGSVSNGVRSENYGPWEHSFTFSP